MGIYWSLFIAFARVGMFAYGGGPSMIPLMEREVVQTFSWLTPEEFTDALAMANTLPGPIATKMAICVGLQVGGPFGAFWALFSLLLPSSVMVIALMVLYQRYRTLDSVQGIVRGVRPVVISLLLVTAAQLGPRSVFSWDTFLVAVAAFALVFYLNVHPIYTIVAAALIGLWFYR